MKLNHKQKARKARQMLARIEKATYWFDPKSNQWHRKTRTPLFQSRRWNLMREAKALRLEKRRNPEKFKDNNNDTNATDSSPVQSGSEAGSIVRA